MLTRFTDFDQTFDLLEEFRRQMDRVWDDLDDRRGGSPAGAPSRPLLATNWPQLNAFDTGTHLVLQADLPGVSDKDVSLTLHEGVLTVSGERKIAYPEGYTVQRRERAGVRFSRSLTLPFKVDAEKTTATVKDGVLTISLAKTPEAQPRQITVKAQQG